MKLEDVEAFVGSLPGVSVGARWGHRTWMIGERGFAWQRPFSKADLKRFGDATPPAGDILAIMVDGLDAKDALLAIAPPGVFTIPHFDGFPAVLVELRRARVADVRALLRAAHAAASARAAGSSARKPRSKRRAPAVATSSPARAKPRRRRT